MTAQVKDERHALNCHGVFLKKRVLEAIRTMPKLHVFAEEFAVSFNEPVAIDLIATDEREARRLFFVFECKRAYTKQKTWVFFKDFDQEFRFCRVVSTAIAQFGQYARGSSFEGRPPICSEGYELVETEKSFKADQNPVFEAGNQMCKGFLGFVQTRIDHKRDRVREPKDVFDCIFPVLVTTADLRVADFDVSTISLQTGNLESALGFTPVDWLILKQPFSVMPDTSPRDFRDNPHHQQDQRHWSQVHKESLFVVNAAKLSDFLNGSFREDMHDWLIQ